MLMLRVCLSTYIIGLIRVPNAKESLQSTLNFVTKSISKYLSMSPAVGFLWNAAMKEHLRSLKSYFLREGFSDARFNRLKDAFSNPLLEPVLLFHNASMQQFT